MSVFNPTDFAPPIAVSLQYLQANYTTTTDLSAELETKAPITWSGTDGQNYMVFPDAPQSTAFSLFTYNEAQPFSIDTTTNVAPTITLNSRTKLQNLNTFIISINGANTNANAALAGIPASNLYVVQVTPGVYQDPSVVYQRTS